MFLYFFPQILEDNRSHCCGSAILLDLVSPFLDACGPECFLSGSSQNGERVSDHCQAFHPAAPQVRKRRTGGEHSMAKFVEQVGCCPDVTRCRSLPCIAEEGLIRHCEGFLNPPQIFGSCITTGKLTIVDGNLLVPRGSTTTFATWHHPKEGCRLQDR